MIDEDYTGELKILASLSQGTLKLEPKVPIAQLILIPRFKTENKVIKPQRGSQGFGSTDVHWMQLISADKPYLCLKVNGKNF